MSESLEHLPYEERLRDQGLFGLQKTERGSYQHLSKGWVSKGWVSNEWGQAHFSGVQQQDKRQWEQTKTQEVPCEHDGKTSLL